MRAFVFKTALDPQAGRALRKERQRGAIVPAMPATLPSSGHAPEEVSERNLTTELEFVYAQLLDSKFQRRMRQAKPLSRPVRTRNAALRGAQSSFNHLALMRLELA